MKLNLLKIENFGPFVNTAMALNDRGLLLVQGDNLLSTSADSNGSGKSSLLESIVWGLYGKTIRYELNGKPTGDMMVNGKFGPTPGKNCVVTQSWIADGRTIVITRYRKHAKEKNAVFVEIDGTDFTRGTSKETDRFIEELIGLDFNAFVRSVYFSGSSVVPFPTLTDKEIKETFEKVLGLDDLAKVAAVVKERMKVIQIGMSTAENDVRLEATQASTAEVERQTAEGRAVAFVSNRDASIKSQEDGIKTLEASPVRPTADIDADEAKTNALEQELLAALTGFAPLDGMLASWNSDYSNHRASIASQAAYVQQLRSKPAVVSDATRDAGTRICAEIAIADRERNSVFVGTTNAEALIGKACGECGKTYTESDLDHIVSHGKIRLAALDLQIDGMKAQHSAYVAQGNEEIEAGRIVIDAQIATESASLDALIAELTELEAKKPRLDKLSAMRADTQMQIGAVPAARAKLAEARHERQRLDDAIAVARASVASQKAAANPYDGEAKRWEFRRDNHNANIAGLEETLNLARGKLAMLKVLDEAYGRTGLKAHILETITPMLNARANDYASRLADGQVKIEFSTVTKLRDGTYAERFSVNVVNDQGAEGYLGNSSGEQRKIDLSIGLALSDMVAARSSKSIDLWVADEVAESLDPTAVDRVVDVLKAKAATIGTVLVISHSDMADLIPAVITVRKTLSGADIIDGVAGGW